ncbi:uncharacterized protein LOC123500990 [Portunus trituberculatus]|uniref:uncharacterized protein LOC123500990 n=1 Tax=Portunus trituberculatus TaxID=210409 RepID=UPI001E1D1CD2|nr:uncharacterized protein LOC123500990 [Portunus trituberculatus]
MSDQRDKAHETPRRSSSSSSDRKRPTKDSVDIPAKKRKSPLVERVEEGCIQPRPDRSSPPPVAGPSHANTAAECSSGGDDFNRLTALLSDLIGKLDKEPTQADVLQESRANFSAFHNISSSEDEATEISECLPDPLDELDTFNSLPPSRDTDEADF